MRIAALSITALLLLAAIAAPAMAEHNDRHSDRHDKDEAKADRDAAKAERDAAKHDRRAMGERCREAHNETGEVPQACKQAAKKMAKASIVKRCEADENGTGDESRVCKAAKAAHKADKQARRAADHAFKALFGLEKRLFKLELLEAKFEAKLEGNITENQTAAFEAKLEKIDAAQNATQMRIDDARERLEGLKDRWAAVHEHIEGKKIAICHQGDDGNKTIRVGLAAWAAHERHGDVAGACAGDDPDADQEESDGTADEPEPATGNQTAEDPASGSSESTDGAGGNETQEPGS